MKKTLLRTLTLLSLSMPVLAQVTDDFCSFGITAALPQPAAGIAAVRHAENIYAIGGYGYFMNAVPIASNLIRIYNTQTNSWSVSSYKLNTPRMYLAALGRPDGKIIIAGGISQEYQGINTVELFDPAAVSTDQAGSNLCQILGNMSCARKNPVLNLLKDGRILITGNTREADIIEQDKSGKFIIRPVKNKMNHARHEHAAVRLADGRVLLITGRQKSMEIFDPHLETFTLTKTVFDNYYDDQATALLHNGKVLIVGGQNTRSSGCTNQTWLYDPEKDKLTPNHTLVPFSNDGVCQGMSDVQVVDLYGGVPEISGRVFLLCGGEDDNGKKDAILRSAWLYLTHTNEFLEVGPMNQPHDDFKAVAFSDNTQLRALIIDGHSANDKITGCVEIFKCQSGIQH
ncbi:MAG: hypothetical protein JW745_08195 [Sedimentisphaerales bacterium]|nr:hypothetical protein [Sedimentisphaerales bacterium]MBN2842936.1 hypothetical protein [Sedimentisphaerales bacterium]